MITNTHLLILIVAQSALTLFLYDLNKDRMTNISRKLFRIRIYVLRLSKPKRKILYEYKTLQALADNFEEKFNELIKDGYTPCSEMVVLITARYYIVQQFKRKKIRPINMNNQISNQ